jgi:dCTP deaminase
MLLHWESLRRAMEEESLERRLVVMPILDFDRQVGPASVDLRLGTAFRILRRTDESGLDPGDQPHASVERMTTSVDVEIGDKLWLHPGQFVLGSTFEFLRLPAHLGAYVLGRSSWGRVGLLVATAIFVQPGFSGCLTLELVNHGESPIALYPGSRIAQLAVHELSSATERYYGRDEDKYVGPIGPQVAHLAKEAVEIKHLREVGQRLIEPGRQDPPASGPSGPRK